MNSDIMLVYHAEKVNMRTLVDIPESELTALNALSKSRSTSRAELVRQAIKTFVENNKPVPEQDGFGIWAHKNIDGLEYQLKMRAEWDREWDKDTTGDALDLHEKASETR
jgi:hypothetical protein